MFSTLDMMFIVKRGFTGKAGADDADNTASTFNRGIELEKTEMLGHSR